MLMLSSPQFDGSAAAKFAAPALEEGRIVVLEHVNQDEINEFISALDGEQKEFPILSNSDDPGRGGHGLRGGAFRDEAPRRT